MIHFAPATNGPHAAARAPLRRSLARALGQRAVHRVANDTGVSAEAKAHHDAALRAALRHFAEHGLSAARRAREEAEAAFFAGDRPAYDWWLSVTRTLDRRLAAEAEERARSLGQEAQGDKPER
ncbi:MAG: hypothetical protein AAF650_05585 [Pseudomonadota bacterium]